MGSIGAIAGNAPAAIKPPPAPAQRVDHDGDHDNDATESHAAKAQENAGPPRPLNTIA